MTTVSLSMISHTNVGKTTLARTLLRRDIGEVRDEPHVTMLSEAHPLVETADARLVLWDTPGFGDSVKLLKRLRREGDPLGWLLHQVWDRLANPALWCSQEAVRNIRDEADAVLYLVNAAEEPHTAGYVEPELELLAWTQRPVLVLLNQIGAHDAEGALARWRNHLGRFAIVRDVLPLDAFSRAWVEESVMLERLVELLEGDKREAMARLAGAWRDRGRRVFEQSVDALADCLAAVAVDRESVGSAPSAPASLLQRIARDLQALLPAGQRRAMGRLLARVQTETRAMMTRLIALHELSGGSAAQIEQRIEDVIVAGNPAINKMVLAVFGSMVSGLLTGLGADVVAGGLTFGGGAVLGAIAGAAGGYVLGGAYRMVAGEPAVQWQPAALDNLTREALLRYLTVAHFGRGRGEYTDLEYPAHWVAGVDRRLERDRHALQETWRKAARGGPAARGEIAARLQKLLDAALRDLLRGRFPRAAVLDAAPGSDAETPHS